MTRALWAALAVLPLAACAALRATPAPAQQAAFAGLGGTSWQLVEIQSMDDAQGTTRPEQRADYTLTFNADGTLAMRLDCNRATGTWRNDGASTTGGTLTFGPMAVTRALCPAPTLGEVLERQMPWVRSFIMRDGLLNMALMADGGILVWEPLPAKP